MNSSQTQVTLFRRFIGLALLGLALLGATSLAMKEIPLALFGVHTTGTVKKVEVIQTSSSSQWVRVNGSSKKAIKRGGDSTFLHIDFTTQTGEPHQIETLATFNTVAKVGDQHPMVYLPSHPERAKIYSAKQLWLPLCVGSVFTLVCLLLGIFLIRSRPTEALAR